MPTAYARTDGTGRILTGVTALRPLSKEEMYGERVNPLVAYIEGKPRKRMALREFLYGR